VQVERVDDVEGLGLDESLHFASEAVSSRHERVTLLLGDHVAHHVCSPATLGVEQEDHGVSRHGQVALGPVRLCTVTPELLADGLEHVGIVGSAHTELQVIELVLRAALVIELHLHVYGLGDVHHHFFVGVFEVPVIIV
jgi:hypothetical protein